MLTTVSGVAPLAVLAEALGQELVVPEPDGFQALAPGGEHADRGPAAGFHQPRHAGVIEHGILQRRRGAEPLVHGRGAFEQMLHVEAHHGRRQQADGAEDREASAHAVGDGEDVVAAEGVGQIAEPARLAGDRNHAAAELLHVAAARLSQGVEEDAEGDGRFQRAAALADDDDAPVVARLRPDRAGPARRRCRRCCPRSRSAAGRRAAGGKSRCDTDGSRPRTTPGRPCTSRRCRAPPPDRPPSPAGRRGDDPIQQRPVFVQQPLGQVEEGGVQRLHLLRHRPAALVQRQVVEHFLPGRGQPRGQPLQVGLDQARLPHKRRGVLRGDQTGIVVGDGGEGFHGRGQGLGVRDQAMSDE